MAGLLVDIVVVVRSGTYELETAEMHMYSTPRQVTMDGLGCEAE